MKATELIEELTKAISLYGDLEVSMTVTAGDCGEINGWVSDVVYDKTNNEIELR